MNKADKRQRSIRNKLLAAVAMLLVASIMTVSTTYAWFTLSTAPEVQGITTTVGANGNLEIALSPLDGNVNELGTAVGDANKDWLIKNTTWGNLLDLSHEDYELDKIVMMPSQLQATSGKISLTSPVGYPEYGTDGRITELAYDTLIGIKQNTNDVGSEVLLTSDFKYIADTLGYGVRAVGTATGMTENEKVMLTAKAALRGGIAEASRVASASLNANGQALASMMVDHALATRGGAQDTTNNYAGYVVAVTALVDALDESVEEIDSAMKGMLLILAANQLDSTTTPTLETAQSAINGATDMGTFDPTAYVNMGTAGDAYTAVKNQRAVIVGYVDAANEALDDIGTVDENSDVKWDQISPVLSNLMNTSSTNLTVNGHTVADVAANYTEYVSDMLNGVQIIMGKDTGVYYEIHKMASKVSAACPVTINAGSIISGMGNVTLKNCTIETVYTENNGVTMLGAAQTAVMDLEAKAETAGANAGTKLDVFYGYILDFVFRTNAANTSLYLQTDAANRVYQDGGSEATMGAGSKISFNVPEGVDAAIVTGLVEGIRLAFFDTATGDLHAMAKATSVAIEETTTTGENGASVTTKTVVGTLELCSFNNDGAVKVDGALTDDTTTTLDESSVICALDQNVAERVSVLVSLDGESVTNADILAEGKVAGVLNLQFASSANLVPMENAGLRGGNEQTPANP